MKLTITTDEGLVLDTIEDIEMFNLDKPMAAANVAEEIASIMKAAVKRGDVPASEIAGWFLKD